MLKRFGLHKIVFLTEVLLICLMALNFLPRSFSWPITGLLCLCFIFFPIVESVWLFIMTIPLFVALPLTFNFDSLANWRIMVLVLFLVWFGRHLIDRKKHFIIYWFKANLPNRLIIYALIFLAIGLLSLFSASDKIIGLKKIIFFVNAGLLFFITQDLVSKAAHVKKLFAAALGSVILTLIISYGQLISTMFLPLHVFWKFWAIKIIPLFYGQNLAKLLEYSNTWFAYYQGAPPTLRVFSVFPDSHSFALYVIIGIIFILSYLFLVPRRSKLFVALYYLLLVLSLLTLLFTGSRGVWVSALVVVVVVIFVIVLGRWLKYFKAFYQSRVAQLVAGSLILLFVLFPLSSLIQFMAQSYQMGVSVDQFLIFKRMRSAADLSELSVKNRLQIWQKTLESISQKPLLGVGVGNYPIVLNEDLSTAKKGASAHNLYLDIAAEMGFYALFIFLAMSLEIWRTALNLIRQQRGLVQVYAVCFALYFLWILSYSIFDVVLFNDKVLLFFIFATGILYGFKNNQSFSHPIDL